MDRASSQRLVKKGLERFKGFVVNESHSFHFSNSIEVEAIIEKYF